jgi:hypothetical protein
MRALAASLGFFGLSKFAKAEEPEFKYSKFFRRCDEATMDEFRDIVYMNDAGKVFKVPIIWATDEKAEAFLQSGGLGDGKIKLPLINIYRGDLFFAEKVIAYYHLTIRSLYEEHINQIVEQAVVKFHPKLKSKVGEFALMSMINNYYPGGSASCHYGCRENAMRGDIFSGAKHGKQGEWILYEQYLPDSPIRILKHQLNLLLTIEGKP